MLRSDKTISTIYFFIRNFNCLYKADSLLPCVTNPFSHAGQLSKIDWACCWLLQVAKTHAPVPVNLDGAYSIKASIALATSGYCFLTKGSQSLCQEACNNCSIEHLGVFRISSLWVNTLTVATCTGGTAITYQGSATSTLVSFSPTPSAIAARP